MHLTPHTTAGRRFVELADGHLEEFRSRAAGHDANSTFVADNFEDLKASGLIGAFVPAELGGLDLQSVHDWAAGLERLGRADASTAIAVNMHFAITRRLAGAWRGAIAAGEQAAAERNEGMLRAITAGQLVLCATATEPGTDFLRPKTTATPDGEGWRINGRKVFVTLSPIADVCALNLRIPGSKGTDGAGEAGGGDRMGFAFLPMTTAGFELQDDWDALGMRGSGSQSLVLNDCPAPPGSVQMAGEWGRGNPQVLMGRTLGNLTLVAVFLGIAERARELAVEAALSQSKSKFDGPIALSSGVQHLVGEIDIDLAAARATLGACARRIDELLANLEGKTPALEVAHQVMRDYQCAKWIVNQNAIRIVGRAMDVAGGSAYMTRSELSRLYRDVRAGPFMQPFTPTEAREYVGRIALGLYPEG